MNRRLIIIAATAVVIASAAGTVLALRRHNPNPPMATVAQAQASAPKHKPACRADNQQDLHLSARDTQDISMAGVTYLTDVPAGTNVDVRITTYDGKTMTGSSIYPSKYGSYNFEAKKIAGATVNQISWQVTGFTACE